MVVLLYGTHTATYGKYNGTPLSEILSQQRIEKEHTTGSSAFDIHFSNNNRHFTTFYTMASRSSGRNSLLAPPTTVAEDEDSAGDELPVHDENLPTWTYHRKANDALVKELDDFALASPVKQVIDEFNEELDLLVNSFDGLLTRQEERGRHEASTSFEAATPHSQYLQSSSSSFTATKTPFQQQRREPLQTAERPSPLRNKTSRRTPTGRSTAGSYTPSEPPPAPMETPGYAFPTPNRQRTRRTSAPRVHQSPAYSNAPRQEPTPSSRVQGENLNKMEEMYSLIREQENRIQDLEIENEVLHTKLRLQHPPAIERVVHHDSIPPSSRPPSEDRASYHSQVYDPVVDLRRTDHRSEISAIREEPDGRHEPSVASLGHVPSPYRTQQTSSSYISTPNRRRDDAGDRPPRHIRTFEDNQERIAAFTPGTQFVAELATLMKIENSHAAPLSVIIDRHWDQLKHHFENHHH